LQNAQETAVNITEFENPKSGERLKVGDRFLAEGEGDYIEELSIVEISPDRNYIKVTYADHENAERESEWLDISEMEVLTKLGSRP
jgi:hypothetical protein